jgi:hypothetical protein
VIGPFPMLGFKHPGESLLDAAYSSKVFDVLNILDIMSNKNIPKVTNVLNEKNKVYKSRSR